jgi:zinc protease
MTVAPPLAAAIPAAGPAMRHRFANGFELVLLPNRQAPIVTAVLVYRAGGRDEEAGASGAAHFLEHMMFKGSARYGPGEIDRLTQALGGINNAFTSHDSTAYYFAFANDRWREALAIERDRMTGLTLDPAEIDSERHVILEELAMYRDDPWDALELAVQAELYPKHPYGVPVLGREEDLRAMDRARLAGFASRFYRPASALLVLAGDLGSLDDARAAAEEAFGDLPTAGGSRPPVPTPRRLDRGRRIEKVVEGEGGEVARLLVAVPAPPPDHADYPGLRLLSTILGGGRASRLHRAFVDVGQLCLSADCGVNEMELGSNLACALELLPGVDPEEVEERLLAELALLRDRRVEEPELERARRVLRADWVFQQERIHQQGIVAALAAAPGDLDLPRRIVERAVACDADEVRELAARWLDPARGGVVGLSRPAA